jgi:DNA invertase Pin-like site-specific DNA recombinase
MRGHHCEPFDSRLARSMRDLQNIVHELKQMGVSLRATEQPIDTSTSAGKAFLDMLGVFAEFETNLRRERQAEGIANAKKATGRPQVAYRAKVLELRAAGMSVAAICKEVGAKSRSTVYDIINAADAAA